MFKKSILLILCVLFFSCTDDLTIKSKGLTKYNMVGYLSSRKDKISLDMSIKCDLLANKYSIRGFDTLLSKERFFVVYKLGGWFFKEKNNFFKVDESKKFGDILPPPNTFNYLAFLKGDIPILKNSTKSEQNKKIIYKNKNYTQEIELEKNEKINKKIVKNIILYKKGKKIYKIVYKKYVIVKQDDRELPYRIFPKVLNIFDYNKKKKLVWWFSKIQEIKE